MDVKSDVSNTKLYDRARQAAHDYRTIHGSYPDRIGLHFQRFYLSSFPYRHIVFPERTKLPSAVFMAELSSFESMTYKQHMAMFEPVIGEAIEYNEVYLPIPGEEHKVQSATQLGYLAAEQERKVKLRRL